MNTTMLPPQGEYDPNFNDSAFTYSIATIILIMGIVLFCICYIVCCQESHYVFHTSRPFDVNEEERRENRRLAILSNVIHKKVLQQEQNEGISLPHKKEITKRKRKKSIRASIIDVETPENIEGSCASNCENSGDDSDGESASHDTHIVENMNNISMQSLRRSMRIKTKHASSSLYSPHVCPICMGSYLEDEEIAWSNNKECYHAFHLDCIMEWLLNHDTCPMCRLQYLDFDDDSNV